MKNTWESDNIRRKYGRAVTWANVKAEELSIRHGTPFCWHEAHGLFVFLPRFDFKAIQAVDAPGYESELVGCLKRGPRNFLQLKEHTGWHWDVLFAVAKRLVETGRAWVDVDRMGHPTFLCRASKPDHQSF